MSTKKTSKRGRPSTSDNTHSFQITISRPAYAYLLHLSNTTTMGGTPNAVAAFIVIARLEEMRISGSYPAEIPPEAESG